MIAVQMYDSDYKLVGYGCYINCWGYIALNEVRG
jgi:hypothetical protein